jgi:hypothetical protein
VSEFLQMLQNSNKKITTRQTDPAVGRNGMSIAPPSRRRGGARPQLSLGADWPEIGAIMGNRCPQLGSSVARHFVRRYLA